jgi:hypothetical protein
MSPVLPLLERAVQGQVPGQVPWMSGQSSPPQPSRCCCSNHRKPQPRPRPRQSPHHHASIEPTTTPPPTQPHAPFAREVEAGLARPHSLAGAAPRTARTSRQQRAAPLTATTPKIQPQPAAAATHSFLTRHCEWASQNAPPHMRQWCRRVNRPKLAPQPSFSHAFASSA